MVVRNKLIRVAENTAKSSHLSTFFLISFNLFPQAVCARLNPRACAGSRPAKLADDITAGTSVWGFVKMFLIEEKLDLCY